MNKIVSYTRVNLGIERLFAILLAFLWLGCKDSCPPRNENPPDRPSTLSVFIDNSGSMAALFYQNTRMQDFLIGNLIAGIQPVSESPQCFLISNKLDTVDINTLRDVVGARASIVRKFNGSGSPLHEHFATAMDITGKDGIGLFITDGILCASAAQLRRVQREIH
mgnify:CR=1 FL=1